MTDHKQTALDWAGDNPTPKPIWGRIADRVRDARNERELDRWAFEDRHRDDDAAADWAALPWWRKLAARVGGRG